MSPDENNSNRWQDVLEVTNRCYMADIYPEDDRLSPDGRVMEYPLQAGADVARQGMVSRVVSLVRHYLFGWIS